MDDFTFDDDNKIINNEKAFLILSEIEKTVLCIYIYEIKRLIIMAFYLNNLISDIDLI